MARKKNIPTTSGPEHPDPRALNAVKHGGFSNLAVFPGEDFEEFKRLGAEVFDELKISGPLEREAALHLTKLIWRKCHLGVYGRAEKARAKWAPYHVDDPDQNYVIDHALMARLVAEGQRVRDLYNNKEWVANEAKVMPALKEVISTLDDLVKQTGADMEKLRRDDEIELTLALLGEEITPDKLVRELEVTARLDTMIDRAIKRIMHLKAIKSMLRPEPEVHIPPGATSTRPSRTIEHNEG